MTGWVGLNGPPAPRWLAAIGPGLLAVLFAALAWLTWGGWPDVFIDFGRELYLPWRIVEGEVLYRDLASFNGPLSAYVNAGWFAIAGAGVWTLFLANLALLALLAALCYRLLHAISDRYAAFLGTAVFLCVSAYGQQVAVGNYNFVAPYAHELTHGLILGLGALAALERWRRRGRWAWLVAGGVATGLALLTKPETGLATLLAASLMVIRSAGVAATGTVFWAAVLAPSLVAVLLLALAMPLPDAAAGVLAPWRSLVEGGALSLPFYRELMGIDHPWHNLVWAFTWAGVWWLVLAPALVLADNWRAGERAMRLGAGAIFVAYAALLLSLRYLVRWQDAAMPLGLFTAGVLALSLLRPPPELRHRLVAPLALFALVMLGKLALHPRLYHYGFALAMPALVLVSCALAGWLPAMLDRKGRRGILVRAAAAGLLAAVALVHVEFTADWHGGKTVVVGEGRDALRADARGRYVNQALQALRPLPPEATVLVLPEGVMLNFLLRRRNPTPYVSFMPLELGLFGEAAMLEALRREPPDRIVLVHKDTTEFGVPVFGRDYGVALMRWVRTHYAAQPPFGDVPLRERSLFGIQILAPRPQYPASGE